MTATTFPVPMVPRLGVARTTPKRPRPDGRAGEGLKSVATALDVLECFALDDELGVSDIARRLGIAKSTAHRLLTTLCSRGMAEKNLESGQYRLGMHLFELGQLAQARMRLRQLALPLLGELRRSTGHTVHLSVADGIDIVHVERLDSHETRGVMVNLGRRFPSHCTATGKVMAAFNPELAQARRQAGFPPRTRLTIRTVADFDAALDQTRRLGFAMAYDESVPGIGSIAAPVRDLSGRAIAAVSVAGPTAVIRAEPERTARQLVAVACQLSKLAMS